MSRNFPDFHYQALVNMKISHSKIFSPLHQEFPINANWKILEFDWTLRTFNFEQNSIKNNLIYGPSHTSFPHSEREKLIEKLEIDFSMTLKAVFISFPSFGKFLISGNHRAIINLDWIELYEQFYIIMLLVIEKTLKLHAPLLNSVFRPTKELFS